MYIFFDFNNDFAKTEHAFNVYVLCMPHGAIDIST